MTTDLDITFPPSVDTDTVVTVIEAICAQEALQISMKSTLKKYPGCIHWHFKKRDMRGVLEVTWWQRSAAAKPSRLWLSTHGNRDADWISELTPRLKTSIEDQLSV